MRHLIISLALVLLAGCAATGVPFVAQDNADLANATVHVYRPARAVNCCVAPYILINDEKRGQLKNGGYMSFVVPPGPITVEAINESAGFKSLKLTLDGKAGQSYYLRWSAAAAAGWSTTKLTPEASIFQSEEAKKRAQAMTGSAPAGGQRAVDFQPVPNAPMLLSIEHERELREVDASEARQEIAVTRKSQ